MSDLSFYSNEIETKVKSLQRDLDFIRDLGNDATKADLIRVARNEVSALETSRRIFNMELRQVEGEDKSRYREKLLEYDLFIQKALADLDEFARQSVDRDAEARGALMAGRTDPEQIKPAQMNEFQRIHTAQDQTEEALQRTLAVANETTDIGDAMLTRLDEQTKQLENIEGGLHNIDSELDRAKNVMSSLLKRLVADRFILIVVALVVLGVVGLIIYLAVAGI